MVQGHIVAIWEASAEKMAFVGNEELLLNIKKENLGTKPEQSFLRQACPIWHSVPCRSEKSKRLV